MNEAGITAQSNSRPAGIVFNRAMGELLRQYKLSDIDKGDRSRLLQMMQFRAEITEWHQGLPDSQHVRFNQPSTVWRHVRSLPSDPPPTVVQPDRDPPFRWQAAARDIANLGSAPPGPSISPIRWRSLSACTACQTGWERGGAPHVTSSASLSVRPMLMPRLSRPLPKTKLQRVVSRDIPADSKMHLPRRSR